MKVHILDGLGNPTTLDATRLVVATDSGTPVALVIELLPGMIETSRAEDDDFNTRLRVHGINRSVQVAEVRAPRIADFEFQV
jgi:hypothetical protein